jgi:choline dehydrogenase-like flavoprotein
MTVAFDVIIVGSGPAGVSAAFPLAEAGLQVLLVDADDGSGNRIQLPPVGNYLDLRRTDSSQDAWLLGKDLHAIRQIDATSPKVRVAGLKYVFDDFAEANKIVTDGFTLLGSLAAGGLSNAWGCGVARFDEEDLKSFPVQSRDLDQAYAAVCRRIGISGRCDDDLQSFFGVDEWATSPGNLERNGAALNARYLRKKSSVAGLGVRFGRSRVAILTEGLGERQSCIECGLCLWGCRRNSLYSARHDLENIKLFKNVLYQPGVVVDALRPQGRSWVVSGTYRGRAGRFDATARTVALAAGTLATTRLVLKTLDLRNQPLRLLSSPAVAFLVLIPQHIGKSVASAAGYAQTAFAIDSPISQVTAYGGLFATVNLPVNEFLRYIPTSRATAIALWKTISPATLVGNCFLPGKLSGHAVTLDNDGRLVVRGGDHPDLKHKLVRLRSILPRVFAQLGALVVPGSMVRAAPGSDIHYAGTLPMQAAPKVGETDRFGEVQGLPGIFVVDGASLSDLPAKPHTLTIMANATRIASFLARRARPSSREFEQT